MLRVNDNRSIASRKKNILYLIEKYLSENGYEGPANVLRKDANLTSDYSICDNVDLDTMYLEFCSYFQLKFGKLPDILRHLGKIPEKKSSSSTLIAKDAKKPINPNKEKELIANKGSNVTTTCSRGGGNDQSTEMLNNDKKCGQGLNESLKVSIAPSFLYENSTLYQNYGNATTPGVYPKEWDIRLLKEFEDFDSEWRELAIIVCRDLVKKDFGLKLEHVFGNEKAINAIKEAVFIPLDCPQYFAENDVKPWKAILLHGPPGTGKTLIAKALCSEIFNQIAFFNVSASTIISKWRGESEKLIHVLFDVAKMYAPSIIFIDEVDGLTSRRDSIGDHEASKRFKNEFLSLLDSLDENNYNKRIFVLASTNLPWVMDPAFLRRFERKILVELPDFESRKYMIKHFLPNANLTEKSLSNLAQTSEGLTGDDIRVACKEVQMNQLRFNYTMKNDKILKVKSDLFESFVLKAFHQISANHEDLLKQHIEWNSKHGTKL